MVEIAIHSCTQNHHSPKSMTNIVKTLNLASHLKRKKHDNNAELS